MKSRKNVGQLDAVKLLPRLESKGVGRLFAAVGVAVLMAEVDPSVPVGSNRMLEAIVALVSSLACNRTGGGLRSYIRSACAPSQGSAVYISWAPTP